MEYSGNLRNILSRYFYLIATLKGVTFAGMDSLEQPGLKVKLLKIQRKTFCNKEVELSKEEYSRLVETAHRYYNERWELIIETICSTGIRVGELMYITIEAVKVN